MLREKETMILARTEDAKLREALDEIASFRRTDKRFEFRLLFRMALGAEGLQYESKRKLKKRMPRETFMTLASRRCFLPWGFVCLAHGECRSMLSLESGTSYRLRAILIMWREQRPEIKIFRRGLAD